MKWQNKIHQLTKKGVFIQMRTWWMFGTQNVLFTNYQFSLGKFLGLSPTVTGVWCAMVKLCCCIYRSLTAGADLEGGTPLFFSEIGARSLFFCRDRAPDCVGALFFLKSVCAPLLKIPRFTSVLCQQNSCSCKNIRIAWLESKKDFEVLIWLGELYMDIKEVW